VACNTGGGAGPGASVVPARCIHISSLSGLSPSNGSFRIAGYLWLILPPGSGDTMPGLELFGRSVTLTPFSGTPMPEGGRYQSYSFEAIVDHDFDLRDYPFDRQALQLTIEATDPDTEILLTPDTADSAIADFVSLPGWSITGLSLAPSRHSYATGFGHRATGTSFSRLSVLIDVERSRSPLLIEKFLGYFVSFLLSGLVLLIPVSELGTRVGITTGSLFAAVFNRYRLEDTIGFDATFGLVDQLSLLTFSEILLILLLSLLAHRMARRQHADSARRLNRRYGPALVGLHTLGWLAALWQAMS
jgi:hypothetical protein